MEAEILASAQEIDFSMWGLFARATLTVKLTMLILVLASFWAWAIIIQKLIEYRRARGEASVFDQQFWSGEPLDGLFDQMVQEATLKLAVVSTAAGVSATSSVVAWP